MTREYDPDRDVTAAELRAAGIPVPESVPACAWVPRGSWTHVDVETTMTEDRVSFKSKVQFTEPFQWLEIVFKLY